MKNILVKGTVNSTLLGFMFLANTFTTYIYGDNGFLVVLGLLAGGVSLYDAYQLNKVRTNMSNEEAA